MAPVQEKPRTLIALAQQAGTFSIFLDALQKAGLTRMLQGRGPYTIFAPDDSAFQRLPKGALKSMMKVGNRGTLTERLGYHVVEGTHAAADVAGRSSLPALSGGALTIEKKGNVIHVDDARIRRTNLEAENGIVHVIDRVLSPPDS